MSGRVQVVFFGEVLAGHAPEVVRQRLGEALKVDGDRLTGLFSGSRRVLKRSLEPAEAQRWVRHLARLGAKLHVEAVEGGVAAATDAPAPHQATARPATPEAPALRLVDKTPAPSAMSTDGAAGQADAPGNPSAAASTDPESTREARARRLEAARERRDRLDQNTRLDTAPGPFGLSLQGRMGRKRYATANLWMFALTLLMAAVVVSRPSVTRLLLVAPFFLPVMFFQMRLSVLRCHDCGKTGWWTLLSFIPSVNAIFALVLSFAPGSEGENDYGEPPPVDGWGRVLLAGLALCLSAALLVFGAMHSLRGAALSSQRGKPAQGDVNLVEFDARVSALPSVDAQEAFQGDYTAATGQKAFAVSPSGAWGWAHHDTQVREAIKLALAHCDANRAAYTARCEPVHVNGRWVAPLPGR